MPLHVNAHPGFHHEETEHSVIPHPPDEEHEDGHKDFPDTGWRGQPPIPSQDGGDSEIDFMNKPPYLWKSEGDKFENHYTSQCWCGDVVFEFHGNPLDAKHCHCHQCQSLHGAPFQWAVIFPKTSTRLVKNEKDHLHFFSTEKRTSGHDVPCKVSCDNCRSPLFDEGKNTVLAYPGSFRFKDRHVPHDFQPTAHIFYEQRVMEVPDGIPKWSGHKGSSKLLPELTADEGKLPKYKGHKEPEEDGEAQKRKRTEA